MNLVMWCKQLQKSLQIILQTIIRNLIAFDSCKQWGCEVNLTKRGERVAIVALLSFMVAIMGVAGMMDAQEQCAKFQASNNVQAALDAGCSFDALPNGDYPYTWTP